MALYIVRDEWDTGYADYESSGIEDAREIRNARIKIIMEEYGLSKKKASEAVRMFRLVEVK